MSNSKVSYMGVGGIDPIAEKKRVVFRPDTNTETVRVGDLVCYNYDLLADYKERTTNPIPCDDDTTYAEGAQTANARLFVVEKPEDGNLEFFAGVVASLGSEGGADGDFIDIFIPNGAVVPVMCDQDCVKNVTVVGVRGDYYEGTYPGVYSSTYVARPIGIAMETIDRSGTDGLCWVKVDPSLFIRQGDYSYRLIIDDEAGSDVTLNQIFVQSNQTAGEFCLLRVDGILNGAGSTAGGLIKVRVKYQAAMDGNIKGISVGLNLGTGFDEGGVYNAAIHASIGSSGTPDLTTLTIYALLAEYLVDESAGLGGSTPAVVSVLGIHAGTYNFDYLLHLLNAGDCGDATVSTADITTQDNASDINIPIRIAQTTYYLRAFITA